MPKTRRTCTCDIIFLFHLMLSLKSPGLFYKRAQKKYGSFTESEDMRLTSSFYSTLWLFQIIGQITGSLLQKSLSKIGLTLQERRQTDRQTSRQTDKQQQTDGKKGVWERPWRFCKFGGSLSRWWECCSSLFFFKGKNANIWAGSLDFQNWDVVRRNILCIMRCMFACNDAMIAEYTEMYLYK